MTVTCCPLSSGEDGQADFYSTSVQAARKAHKCCECEEEIPAGVRYEKIAGVWEGSWSTYRTCLSCVEIRTHFACAGWLFGQVWEDLEQNFFEDMKAGGPCMEGLSPEAKRRLFDRRMEWYEKTHSKRVQVMP